MRDKRLKIFSNNSTRDDVVLFGVDEGSAVDDVEGENIDAEDADDDNVEVDP